VQRGPRYQLLFSELAKNFTKLAQALPDNEDVQQVSEQLDDLVSQIVKKLTSLNVLKRTL
jgi:hypothetical protein